MKDKLIKTYNQLTDRTQEFEFIGVKDFCKKKQSKYKVLAEIQECEELRPCVWKIKETVERVMRILPETYIAEIENATVFGENEFIISDNMVVSDTFTSPYSDKMMLKKGIVKEIELNQKKVVLNYHNYRKFPVKEAFWLVGNFSYSYYHFLINLLPKLYYLYQCDEYKECPLLIDNRAYQNFKPIIDAFNIHKREIICVGANTAYKVKRLIITSNCTWYDRYVLEQYYGDIGHVYDKFAIQFIRSHALSMVPISNERKRIYVSRKKMGEDRKRLVDEDEIETMFHKYGFISICPEDLSFFEQVKLFSQTEAFAGVTGAAFTNIIFLPENATIIYSTCVCENTGENLFPSLWNTIGKGRFIILQGKATEETKNLKDNLRKFAIDTQELEELLRTL